MEDIGKGNVQRSAQAMKGGEARRSEVMRWEDRHNKGESGRRKKLNMESRVPEL